MAITGDELFGRAGAGRARDGVRNGAGCAPNRRRGAGGADADAPDSQEAEEELDTRAELDFQIRGGGREAVYPVHWADGGAGAAAGADETVGAAGAAGPAVPRPPAAAAQVLAGAARPPAAAALEAAPASPLPAVRGKQSQRVSVVAGHRLLLLALLAAGGLAALPSVSPAPSGAVGDAELSLLLRTMGGIKLMLVTVVAAGVWWRLGHRISLPYAVAYGGGVAVMTLAALLLLQLTAVAQAAAVYHAAAFATLVLALQDRVLYREVLPELIARRRAGRESDAD